MANMLLELFDDPLSVCDDGQRSPFTEGGH
jgi:hypothetical protein